MRTFSKQEKWILERIVDVKKNSGLYTISFGTICGSFLQTEYIHINFDESTNTNSITFYFNKKYYSHASKEDFSIISSRQKEIERKIIDSISLLAFLKENRLLFEVSGNSAENSFNIVPNDPNYDLRSHFPNPSLFDEATAQFIVPLLVNKQFIIRQELVDFVAKGFKTEDELHFVKSQRIGWAGIIIAILTSVSSIWYGIYSEKETAEVTTRQMILLDSYLNELKKANQRELSRDSLFMDVFRQGLDVLNKRMMKPDKKVNNTDTLNTKKEKTKK